MPQEEEEEDDDDDEEEDDNRVIRRLHQQVGSSPKNQTNRNGVVPQ